MDWYEDDLIFFLGKLYNDTLVEEQPELLATTKYCFFMRFVYLGLFGKLLSSPCFEKQEEGDYTPNELTRWPMVALGTHSGVDSGMLDTIRHMNFPFKKLNNENFKGRPLEFLNKGHHRRREPSVARQSIPTPSPCPSRNLCSGFRDAKKSQTRPSVLQKVGAEARLGGLSYDQGGRVCEDRNNVSIPRVYMHWLQKKNRLYGSCLGRWFDV